MLLFAKEGAAVLPPPVILFSRHALQEYTGDSVKWRRLLVQTVGATRKRVYSVPRFLLFLRALAAEAQVPPRHAALAVRAVAMMLLECKATSAPHGAPRLHACLLSCRARAHASRCGSDWCCLGVSLVWDAATATGLLSDRLRLDAHHWELLGCHL